MTIVKFKLSMDILNTRMLFIKLKIQTIYGYSNIIVLFIKSLKEGMRKVLVWLEKGTKLETRRRKNIKGLNGVPNSNLDQNSRSNEFGPQFVPIDTNFCA
jgi:hypothetical protein